jgi:GT2 family glycosyltransferase
MHPIASRTFLVTVPPRGRFHAWLALQPEVWDKNKTGATFRVTVAAANGTPRTREWTINPHRIARHRRWVPVSLPLSRFAGQQVELTLATKLPPGGKPADAWALWGDPAIMERRSMRTVIEKEWHLLRDLGVKGALTRYDHLLRGQGTHLDIVYDAWIQQRLRAASEPTHIEAVLRSLKRQPRISVITPVYNTEPIWLRRAVASVRAQTYPHWQLCLADDGSTRADTCETLDEVEALDRRIAVVRNARNGGISAASNAALDRATGEFVALLDHDDELAPNALLEVARVLDAHPDADVVYSDEDKLEMDGRHVEPFFKPDWSPDYLRSSMYIGHLTVYRRSIVEEAGRFRTEFDGSQDYDLALRVTERTDRIHHIPRVLYHWRKIPGSAAGQVDAKPWGINAARRALRDHVGRLPIPATVHEDPGNGLWRVKYEIVGEPLVSIIIPTAGRITRIGGRIRDMPLTCIRSIVERTAYRNYELLLVDDGWLSSELLQYLETVPHRRIVYAPPASFNFAAKINFSCRHASGEHLLLLNDDTEVISGEWLTAMLEFSQQRDIGAVGAKLLYPDGSLQHVGVVLGIGGGACHVLNGQPANSAGYFGSALVIRNYSAVTAACCMTRRDVFEELGGFDERFATDFNDVDYCLRVRAHGYRIVSTPFAQLYHYEGASFGSREHVVNPAEVSALSERWGSVIAADPFYNVNLTRSSLDYRLRLDAEEIM